MNKELIGRSLEKFVVKPLRLVKENPGEALLTTGASYLVTTGASVYLVEKHDYGKSYLGIPVVLMGIVFFRRSQAYS